MNQVKLFIELTRLTKPIGFMLLFWPCVWGLTLAYDFNAGLNNYFFFGILFLSGSILMRSAGCIVNDIVDRKFDKKVERTKNRPIASGRVSVKLAIIYAISLCFLAFLVLLNFNYFTIFMALVSMPLAFTYPLMKRITYWPQMFLGITFNYGLVLGFIAIENQLSLVSIAFYVGAIFWTLGYDTIYGYQDITDDEIIGVKSTSIKFKKSPKKLLFICYFFTISSYLILGQLMNFNNLFYVGAFFMIAHLFIYQIRLFDSKDVENCLKLFKSNNSFGLLVLIFIFLGKINL